MASSSSVPLSLPILDLSLANDPAQRPALLAQLHDALFNVGFLYIKNHGVDALTIKNLTEKLPALFALPSDVKAGLSKLNSPHFLGYSGFAEETTLGKKDLREQFDFATELPVVYHDSESAPSLTDGSSTRGTHSGSRDFSSLYWRLRGPNQWPPEDLLPGFRQAFIAYHDAVQALSYRFVHLVEEAFNIPTGTFDHFFRAPDFRAPSAVASITHNNSTFQPSYLPPQHRIKLLKYPPSASPAAGDTAAQGVGAHKDSSGWLTFLLQVGQEAGLEVLAADDETWIPATPVDGTFVVNFGNAFEAATEGAVRATVHRVRAPAPTSPPRYSIPFFQGLPLDMTVSQVRSYIPEAVRELRRERCGDGANGVSSFLDPRWDALGESQLRKWIRSHEDVGRKWYGHAVVEYYLS
ncbi:hypothetical protein B0J12DRAFT_640212 [Macrophomina phaseolina]|uniref:Fe2OG dioxygenase domain-containing protein n=1 Tax=Macrophomina phaseolina TaxID=35725 RepID=A0ABQ8GVV1_9PEZI|nr:hypothetical protein B0J12DRAFT_640212 [Macrophomina phaseolina]